MTTRELPLPGSSAAPGNRGRFAFLRSGQNADVQRKRTILLVEDETSIAEPLAAALGARAARRRHRHGRPRRSRSRPQSSPTWSCST